MAHSVPARPGQPLDHVDTPALIIDLDAFERNLDVMRQALAGSQVRFRPHAKTHKSPVIALKQMALGAVGVCSQKVSEAEILVEGGVSNVLISNQVVGRAKIDRLAALARHAKIGVCVDDADNIGQIGEACRRFGSTLDVLVELDVGAGRCGVATPEDAARLAGIVADEDALTFAGLQAYEGSAQHIRDHGERGSAIASATASTVEAMRLIADRGLSCGTVAGAGTGTFEFELAGGVYNELQAGSYIFMDADYAVNKDAAGQPIGQFEHALFVLATVMSSPVPERAVLDAGLKAFSLDSGLPRIHGRDGLTYAVPSDEHGVVAVADDAQPAAVGDKLLCIPGHCDPTVNLHDWFVGIRDLTGAAPYVESVWPVAARGAGF